ncbi:MAG: arsenite efflux transporter metallochaperone ArsD [Spirochaetales bacterium]|nr:arsenite efflux transporter metallochaperone ArsD [Spirochaetales bacterium]
MTTIEIFEPAMCCSTGLCGPSIDPELLRVSTEMDELARQGVQVARFNLTSNTSEFVSRKLISSQLETGGVDALPITLVDGSVVKTGAYPTTEELAGWSGVKLRTEVIGLSLFVAPKADEACCSNKNSCDISCKPNADKSAMGESACGGSGCC